jgi:hypothetical protein
MYDVQQKHVISSPNHPENYTSLFSKSSQSEMEQGLWGDKEGMDKESEIKIKVRIEKFVLVWWLITV